MTISSSDRKAGPYTGNGVTTAFAFNFKVFQASDLLVVRTHPDTLADTTLVLDTDYTVTLNSNQNTNPGGTVTLTTALASDYLLTIRTGIDYLQPTDLTNQGGFYPSVINNALDRLTIQVQQLKEMIDRAPLLSVSSTVTTALPVPGAGKYLRWNNEGTELEAVDVATTNTNISYSQETAVATAGQTVFNLAGMTYQPGAHALCVYLNGSRLIRNLDYTETDDNTVTLLVGAQEGDNLLFVAGESVNAAETSASAINYLPGGTGAVWSNVQTKLREFVSVKDFGAVGDGATDDTAAIQAASDLVNSTSGGIEIRIPRGDYVITELDLTNKKGIKFVGDSKTAYAVVKVTGRIICDNTTAFSCENVIFVGNVFDFTTRTVSGAPTAGNYCFDMIDNCAEWDITACHFYGFDQVLRPNAGATNGAYMVNVERNYFGWNNRSVRGDGVLHWTIDTNVFSEDREANIYITSGQEITVKGNKHENSTNALSIANYYFENATLSNSKSIIADNTFHQFYGIVLYRCLGFIVHDNMSYQQKGTLGFVVRGGSEGIDIHDNQIPGTDGVTTRQYGCRVYEDCVDVWVHHNQFKDWQVPLYVDSDYSVVAESNRLSGSTYAAHVTGCGTDRRVILRQNVCTGNIHSSANTNYWTEDRNRFLSGSVNNADGYCDQYYLEGTWTPSPTSLTVVGTPTYTGRFIKIGKKVSFQIDVSSTTSTASTAGATYFSGLPYTAAYEAGCMSVTSGGLQGGVGLITGSRVYPASWTANSATRVSGEYISA